MRDEYDFASMKPRPNPYARKLKKQVTIRLSEDVLQYFREMAADTGMPYQRLIDLYLRDCMAHGRRIALRWESDDKAAG